MKLRAARAEDAEAIAAIHIDSRRLAMPSIALAHPDDEIRAWVATHLVPSGHVTAAEDDRGRVLGYAAVHDGWLDHLYVAPDAQGAGVGAELLRHAKEQSPGGLDLWVFQVNDRARRFYERHGCRAVRFTDGRDNEERAPDVLYRWTP